MTLLDYMPDDFLLMIDESHVTLPQVRGHVRRRPRPEGEPCSTTASVCLPPLTTAL